MILQQPQWEANDGELNGGRRRKGRWRNRGCRRGGQWEMRAGGGERSHSMPWHGPSEKPPTMGRVLTTSTRVVCHRPSTWP